MGAATWNDVERRLRHKAPAEAGGPGWLGLLWPTPSGDAVRVRVELVTIAGVPYVAVVTGGCPRYRLRPSHALDWNATLPPGCTILVEDGCLWLRFVVPLERLPLDRVEALLAFVAREGARLAVSPRGPREAEASMAVFVAFAD